MSRGGARNRSGPAADPNSGRSDKRGLSFKALPNEGFQGEIPKFPKPVQDDRVLQLWEEAWRTPQAAAWKRESWRWPIVAEYCNIAYLVEVEASAALIAQLHRYRDQLGLTQAGLRENGWAIAHPQIEQADDEEDTVTESSQQGSSSKRARDRMKVVVSAG
ncbi:MAG TPA: hypothetical protein VIG71_10735 [Enteractinococcus sp.]